MMATINIPIRTIVSVLPACEIGNVGVGLSFTGEGVAGCIVWDGVASRDPVAVGTMLCDAPSEGAVEAVPLTEPVGVKLWDVDLLGTKATLESATKSVRAKRPGRRNLLIISYLVH